MARIDHKIIMSGIFCLTIINSILILTGNDSQIFTTMIVGVIALAIGVVIIPNPKIDNKRGVLVW